MTAFACTGSEKNEVPFRYPVKSPVYIVRNPWFTVKFLIPNSVEFVSRSPLPLPLQAVPRPPAGMSDILPEP